MINLSLLEPEFKKKVLRLSDLCAQNGLKYKIISGLRTPLEQAALWRKGRGTALIRAQIEKLRAVGADYLGDCIEAAGPQNGNTVTNALPGQSFHNWGEAVDYALFDTAGNYITDSAGYKEFQTLIPKAGLFNYGINWVNDSGHVQARAGSPSGNWAEISNILEKRYPL